MHSDPQSLQSNDSTIRYISITMKEAIKRILVPVDPSAHTEAATETACRIALKHEARVAGIAVLDSPEIRSSLIPAVGPYYPLMIDAVQEKLNHADKLLRDCLDQFARTCEEYQVNHFETEYEGIPAQKLLQSSIFFDLVVMGLETSFHFETRCGKGETLDKLLNQASTPVLAVPLSGMQEPENVLIAFDGSIGSTRALHDFVDFAKPYQPSVTVVVSGMAQGKLDFLADGAVEYLEAHDFSGVASVKSEKPIEAVVDEDMGSNFDLIVAGIHSRHVVKDLFIGSFATSLIQRGQTPLFFSH